MKLALPHRGGAYTGPDIFRAGSLFLYVSLLVETGVLLWLAHPGSAGVVKVALFVVGVLATVALLRLVRPSLLLIGRRHILLELLASCTDSMPMAVQAQLPWSCRRRMQWR
jgi:hypothetical protein